jgi:hypothetical protein
MVESKDFSEESYGVLLLNDDGSKEYFCDITDNCAFITKIVDELNIHHIESCHLNSVLEDFKFTVSSEKNT